MDQIVKVGTVADFEDAEGGKLVDAGGRSLAVFRVGTTYYGIDNACTHRGGSLRNYALGEEVICPSHGAHFNVKTGAVCSPPAREGVKSFPCISSELTSRWKSNSRVGGAIVALALIRKHVGSAQQVTCRMALVAFGFWFNVFINFVDNTDIRVIQSRRGACLTLKSFQGRFVAG